jgi:hypothetical protein
VYDVRSLIDQALVWQNKGKENWPKIPRGRVGSTFHFSPVPSAREEAADQLRHFVMSVVDSASWRDNGGSLGQAEIFGTKLVIIQSDENHRQVGEALRRLQAGGGKDGTDVHIFH